MSTKLGTLRIKRRTFDVKVATLSASVKRSGPIEWFLEVQTADTRYDRELWAPYAYLMQYPSSARSMDEWLANPLLIPSGAEFCAHRILPGCRLCCLYVFEHDYLDDNRIEFVRRRVNRLTLTWTARCAVHWNERYDDNLPLKIETAVDFLGFTVDARDDGSARKLFGRHFDPTGMRFHKRDEARYFLPVPGKW